MMLRLTDFFVIEAAPGGTTDDLIRKFDLQHEDVTVKLGTISWETRHWEDGTIAYSKRAANGLVSISVIVDPDFLANTGRGQHAWAVDVEVGPRSSAEFIYHNEQNASDQAHAEQIAERMKAFIDGRSLADLYSIERSGKMSMSKFKAEGS